MNSISPDNETLTLESSTTSNASSSTIISLGFQQGSRWGPSDIGTVVFGCVASILGILTLWMMFWLRQKDSGNTIRSEEKLDSRYHRIDATASDVDVALGISLVIETPSMRQWKSIERMRSLAQKYEDDRGGEDR